ncbi:MAG: hypothetical protein WBE38_06170 [Terracidiphilus sp.]
MHDREHLSDRELVLAADDELGSERARVHLEACAECNKRVAEFEGIVSQVAQAHRNRSDSQLPSIAGPRAMLRARISDMTARKASRRIPLRLFAGAFGFAALIMVAVASILTMRHSSPRNESISLASTAVIVLPNHDVTPGAVRPASLEQVCAMAQEEVVKEVSPSQRERVFAEYGIAAAQGGDYEVDYLITPGLGGDDDIRNLWPEPYHTATWNAHVKDALEERLHEMVCSRQLDLAAAQKAIATNWIAAYQKYVRAVPAKD